MIPISVAIGALVFAWFAIRTQIGDMIGEFTLPSEPRAEEMAGVAMSLAPMDPLGYALAGAQIRNSFEIQKTPESIPFLEDAARHAPYSYRWWIDLGRANEQEGNFVKAEAALKRAVELAPEYSVPRWYLGNFYLRQGRQEDSIRELRVAARHHSVYRSQVFGIAWNFFGQDPSKVEEFVTGEPDAEAALAQFYAELNRPDDAIRIWNTLSDDQKAQFSFNLSKIQEALFKQHSFRGALEFYRQSGTKPYSRVGAITNGGFELPVLVGAKLGFDWRVDDDSRKVDVGLDSAVKHLGSHSFRIAFDTYVKPSINAIGQNVAVEPGTSYEISFWVRTEGLKSGGLPALSIVDASTGKLIANSTAFNIGTTEWARYTLNFQVPQDTDGIAIRLTREPCGGECPIVGKFWLDDLDMRPLQ